jgi:hypothetical protein
MGVEDNPTSGPGKEFDEQRRCEALARHCLAQLREHGEIESWDETKVTSERSE